jgi:4-amino-4-deoxy-L-arabinose transferase-like glycosyltransferase
LVAGYSLLAAALPPLDDEVYYWSWSKSPQLSYFDHPGMVAWLIGLSTGVFGDTVLGMRFPACCCIAFTFVAIARLMRADDGGNASGTTLLRSVATERRAVQPLLMGVALTPLFTFGAVVITPDAPLVACWSAYLLWLVAIQSRRGSCAHQNDADDAVGGHGPPYSWWLLGGLVLGLGGLSKYTMILAVPAGFVSFLLSGVPWRKWFWGYLVHGVVSVVVASPIFFYNWQHNFEPLLFQWRHAMHDESASLKSFAEFWGVQILLFGTLPLFLVPWTIRHFHQWRASPRLRVCCCLYLVPLFFFVYKATRTELEGNWGLVAFVSAWPMAAEWYQSVRSSRFWRRATAAGFAPPAICVLGLAVLIASPVPLIPVKADRLSRQRGRWEMARRLAQAIQSRGEAIPTFTATYQMTALLRFWGVDARQEATFRASHYTFPPEHLSDVPAAFVVADRPFPPEQIAPFGPPEHLGTFPVAVRGEVVHEYELRRFERRSEVSDLSSLSAPPR